MRRYTLAALITALVAFTPFFALAEEYKVNTLEPVPLGALTADLYKYALTLVGLSVFLMFILAGLAKIIPALKLDSMTIIQNAIIGLIILVSAYVILNSINPDLVKTGIN